MTEDPDGRLFGEAKRRAEDVDRAETPAARRKAWRRFLPSALVAFAEGILRDWAMTGAAMFALLLVVIGALSGDPAATVGLIAVGVLGTGLILLAWRRRWPLRWQWLTTLGVLALNVVAIILFRQRL
jgi:hypothetical protein